MLQKMVGLSSFRKQQYLPPSSLLTESQVRSCLCGAGTAPSQVVTERRLQKRLVPFVRFASYRQPHQAGIVCFQEVGHGIVSAHCILYEQTKEEIGLRFFLFWIVAGF